MTAERVPWVVEGFVAEGAITLIDGKPKASGKTTLVTHLCRKVLDGEPFMGLRTSATGVVYLSEQSTATFREALARAGLQDRDDFAVLLWSDTVGANWNRVVREATEEAVRRGAKLLVVDTLPQFAGLQGDAENSAGAALAAIKPLQEAAAVHGLAVVVVRHERKSGGLVGDSGRGSSAITGAADVVLSVRRVEGNSRPTLREIHALSRFDATPDVLVVELTEGGYVSRGTRAAVAETEAREAVLEAAPADASRAMSLDELLAETGLGRTTIQNALGRLLGEGRLTCTGEGVRGDPRRYWRPGDAAAG
ncbi:MAG: AAA family ATPase [Actinomycetota bacterium]|nr:AAA family ATPase [Actinomycetota bacterium]